MGKRLRISEVADLLHLSVSAVRMIPAPALPSERTATTGRHRRYKPSVVAGYMREHGVEVPAWLDELARTEDT